MDSVVQELNNIIYMQELFDFNDILLEPKKTTNIKSRIEINPSYDGFLPLFTAPMDTVVSFDNHKKFQDLGIQTVMPRGEGGTNGCFISYSLNEIKEFLPHLNPDGKYLIDVANGHMSDLLDATKEVKQLYPNISLMVGNIANPKTFRELSNAGADYIRVGIGNGNGCLTTQQLGVGYPMGSLIYNCYKESMNLDSPAKIVADGGMKDYSDVIKALALGADYVMLGSLLNKAIESAGSNYLSFLGIKIKISQSMAEYLFGRINIITRKKIKIFKKFRGMSTKEVQKKWGRKTLKTSEGVVRYREVEYTLKGWTNNMTDYLKSAMSYCGAKKLDKFIGYVRFNRITQNAYLRFKK
jgi:GMP reductase